MPGVSEGRGGICDGIDGIEVKRALPGVAVGLPAYLPRLISAVCLRQEVVVASFFVSLLLYHSHTHQAHLLSIARIIDSAIKKTMTRDRSMVDGVANFNTAILKEPPAVLMICMR